MKISLSQTQKSPAGARLYGVGQRSGAGGNHVHIFPVLRPADVELNHTIAGREQGVILTTAYV